MLAAGIGIMLVDTVRPWRQSAAGALDAGFWIVCTFFFAEYVLRLIADGYSYEEAGKELFISPETVRAHVAKSLSKLGARTRTQAVAEALRAGLIS